MRLGWKWWGHMAVFWVIMGLHILAILLFTKGFLLTRSELPHYSQCSDVSESPCFYCSDSNVNLNQTHKHQHCWTKPAIGRLVIIVLDALRFDFVAPSTFFQESKPWMDKLQMLQELASQYPSSARIFKAIADPPTTSLQRLKLVQNGKRVTMMGDDTWTQLFPHHFERSYPFPSFNVKDLHTVDNGCIDNLLPSLYQEDWDVLIAHFLGVDHAGHIFGVDSIQMLEKLEQYNVVLQKVIEVLKSQSEPGGLHENTLLLVMGDHGQTINGDHGGGSPEEVETSIFAMSFKKPPPYVSTKYNISSCELNSDKKNLCINSIQQLDFAVTISALLGIPFPFGSIGSVNLELYALGGGTWNFNGDGETCEHQSKLGEWMWHYVNVLCINSWQVKRYIDVYSTSSVIGFSSEDLFHIADLYDQAVEKWSYTKNFFIYKNESCNTVLPILKKQIDAYSNFLLSVADLARSKWTEFNLKIMAIGFGIMLLSIFVHILAISEVKMKNGISFSLSQDSGISFGLFFACFVVAMRAFSFFSNSYILEEGKVACFLLATTGVVKLRDSVMKKKMVLEVIVFLVVITICRFTIEVGLSKQTPGFDFSNVYPSWMLRSAFGLPVLSFLTEIVPILSLILLATLLYKADFFDFKKSLVTKIVAMLSTWSSSIIILLGKQGPLVSIAAIIGGYCIMRMGSSKHDARNADNEGTGDLTIDPLSATQWSFLAVCLFFCTGHWCAFDGLRYGAAFIGFDEFILIRQAILLTIDTFGLSLIVPVYLLYGLIMATTVTATMICVTIHRRHLMVWGLFAPKFVFDVVGLLLTDFVICLASLYYLG
ncbi:Type I phosphodiesterase/nucleotide pyrophosphatase/phosphate transferase [Trema orientale]|uniref:Type I phosphodiesterase/nucleotide pyrophosphatase/phosphate transferase n=1 Tax=Trema orientale TaxID=63057 RepID=A0A2P5E8L9_TREOI|nr:Type I phosphodiesterase/nucleotide pyrophosphatase/phosphate transferase [Trema orientale]